MPDTLQERLYAQLEAAPEARALTQYDSKGRFEWRSRHQVLSQAAGYAQRLQAESLTAGDVMVIVLPSTELAGDLILAAHLLGASPLLVAPPIFQGPHSSLLQILDHTIGVTGASVVVAASSMAADGEKLAAQHPATRILSEGTFAGVAPAPVPPRIGTAPDDRGGLQLTSGTTGFPRVCEWTHRGISAAMDGMEQAMHLSTDDVCFNWTPLYHDMGLMNNLTLCLTKGVPLVMMSPHDFVKQPARWLKGLTDTAATVTWSPNFGFAISAQRVKDSELEGVDLTAVKGFWNAAERIHYETIRSFHERFEAYGVTWEALKTNFGCAENVGGATFSDPDGPLVAETIDREALEDEWIAIPVAGTDARATTIVSAGKAHGGISIVILGDDGVSLPDGRVGEVALDTPSRMKGYLADGDATAAALRGNLLITGDLGYLRGGELFWTGRTKERITVRGRKWDPSDFEPILLDIQGLRAGCFAAFGVDDEDLGTQRIVIVSEVRDPADRPATSIVGDVRRGVLAELGVNVDDVVLVQPGTLTKTSSGKRRHLHFRRLYSRGELAEYEIEDGS